MSFFVFLLYNFKASVKMVSKFVEEVAVGGLRDIVTAEWSGWMQRGYYNKYQLSRGRMGRGSLAQRSGEMLRLRQTDSTSTWHSYRIW